MATDAPQSLMHPMTLRHTLVSMLFALVIAELAIQSSDLVTAIGNEWTDFGLRNAFSQNIWLVLAPITHLILVLTLVCTSWVGWSKSISHVDARDVSEIFSIDFFLLLVELLLVVMYFVLARSVEQNISLISDQHVQTSTAHLPSAVPEALWLMMIYVGYFVWDVFTDALPRHFPAEKRPFFHRNSILSWLTTLLSGVAVRCLVSALSIVGAFAVFSIARSSPQAPVNVVCADTALLCIVIWFWKGKSWEPWIVKFLMPWELHRKGGRELDGAGPSIKISFLLIFAYLVFLCLI